MSATIGGTSFWDLENSTEPRDVVLRRLPNGSLGFSFATHPVRSIKHVTGCFVGHIVGPVSFTSVLRAGDELLEINGQPAPRCDHAAIMLALSQAGDPVRLRVRWNPEGFLVLQRGLDVPAAVLQPGAPPPPNPFELYAATTTADPAEEDREILAGLVAVQRKKWRDAREHFLNALHTLVTPDLMGRIAAAARAGGRAAAGCQAILAEAQSHKAGVYYLLGMVHKALKHDALAMAAFAEAIRRCQPDMAVNLEPGLVKDPDFHYVVALGLARQQKLLVAAAALRQAMVVASAVPPQCRLDFAALVAKLPSQQQQLFGDPVSLSLAAVAGSAAARPAVVAEPCRADPGVAAEAGSFEHADCSPAAPHPEEAAEAVH